MTGFGRAEAEREGRKITIEMKSVNHRFLDLNIRMPRALLFAEDELRAVVKERISRGRLDIFVNYTDQSEQSRAVTVDLPLINAYIDALRQVKDSVSIDDDLSLSHIMRIPDAIKVEERQADEEEITALLKEAAAKAVDMLYAAREREGKGLCADMEMRLGILAGLVERIESKEDAVVDEYREKLKKRLEEASVSPEVDEARLAQEVIIYADRQNITEETVRIRGHIKSFAEALCAAGPSGRQLDFIVQELNREFNTIGSKSADMDITNAVLTAKSEIEKIREQVQNLE